MKGSQWAKNTCGVTTAPLNDDIVGARALYPGGK